MMFPQMEDRRYMRMPQFWRVPNDDPYQTLYIVTMVNFFQVIVMTFVQTLTLVNYSTDERDQYVVLLDMIMTLSAAFVLFFAASERRRMVKFESWFFLVFFLLKIPTATWCCVIYFNYGTPMSYFIIYQVADYLILLVLCIPLMGKLCGDKSTFFPYPHTLFQYPPVPAALPDPQQFSAPIQQPTQMPQSFQGPENTPSLSEQNIGIPEMKYYLVPTNAF